MSLATQLTNLAVRLGTEFKAVYSKIGDLPSLTTTAKSSIVAAVNEVDAQIDGLIDDAHTSTTHAWSSSQTAAADAALKAEILGGADPLWDTLQELHNTEITDETVITGLIAADAKRVRVDAAQAFTAGEKTQGQTNLDVYGKSDIGDPTTDFVAAFNAALL